MNRVCPEQRTARWFVLDDPPADERAEARLIAERARFNDQVRAASWERLLARATVLEPEAEP